MTIPRPTSRRTNPSLSTLLAGHINVKTYGAVGDGVTDDTEAIQAAIDDAREMGDLASADSPYLVFFPQGSYLVGEIQVATDYVWLFGVGNGRSRLKAKANSQYIVRWSCSKGGMRGFRLDGNSKSSVTGLAIVPADETQATTVVNQNLNLFEDLYIHDCAEGVVMRSGPTVGSSVSGCWYNTFDHVDIENCTRGVWLRASGASPAGSPVNRTRFNSCYIHSGMNTGMQVDSGSGTTLLGTHFENISTGTSPNAIPVGLYIAADCGHQRFFGCHWESCTQDANINSILIEFFGCHMGTSKLAGSEAPAFMLGSDPTYVGDPAPNILMPGWKYDASDDAFMNVNNAGTRGLCRIETGTFNIQLPTGDNVWSQAVTFNRAFAAAPIYVNAYIPDTSQISNRYDKFLPAFNTIATTGMNVTGQRLDSANFANANTVTVRWIAIGT